MAPQKVGFVSATLTLRRVVVGSKRKLVLDLGVKLRSQDMESETTMTTPTIKAGDILNSSWGYDQTNVDFYQVTRVTPSGKTVYVQKVGTRTVREDVATAYVVPDTNVIEGDVLRRRVNLVNYSDTPKVSIAIHSFEYAYPWNGEPQAETGSHAGH